MSSGFEHGYIRFWALKKGCIRFGHLGYGFIRFWALGVWLHQVLGSKDMVTLVLSYLGYGFNRFWAHRDGYIGFGHLGYGYTSFFSYLRYGFIKFEFGH